MIFKGKVVKTKDDYAFVLVENSHEICDSNCNNCGHICGNHKPVWKVENKVNAQSGDKVKVESSTWKAFIGKLPEAVEIEPIVK